MFVVELQLRIVRVFVMETQEKIVPEFVTEIRLEMYVVSVAEMPRM